MDETLCLDFSHCQATMTSDDFTGLAVLLCVVQGLTLNRDLELNARNYC